MCQEHLALTLIEVSTIYSEQPAQGRPSSARLAATLNRLSVNTVGLTLEHQNMDLIGRKITQRGKRRAI